MRSRQWVFACLARMLARLGQSAEKWPGAAMQSFSAPLGTEARPYGTMTMRPHTSPALSRPGIGCFCLLRPAPSDASQARAGLLGRQQDLAVALALTGSQQCVVDPRQRIGRRHRCAELAGGDLFDQVTEQALLVGGG